MKKIGLGQTMQILTNIGVIISISFLAIKLQQDNIQLEVQSYQEEDLSTLSNAYIDISAVKCPSAYDDETKRFRNENYWLFQKNITDVDISLVLRPNRDTGTWNIDIENKMTITPDYYEWDSFNFAGIYSLLNRKDLSMERRRANRDTVSSQCELINPDDARTAVELRYQKRLEGNKI